MSGRNFSRKIEINSRYCVSRAINIMESQKRLTTEQVKHIPNPNGRGGFGDHPEFINSGGRPKNSLKSYMARKFANMTDKEKEKWLKEHKIDGKTQWTMGEGNPSNETELRGSLTISEVLDALENGQASQGQELENK